MSKTHTGKSIKELVASRLSGYKYRRLNQGANEYVNHRPSLQEIARLVLQAGSDELPDAALELEHKQQAKAERLHDAIIQNELRVQNPRTKQVQTPTMLKKFNPSEASRAKAVQEVARAQTHALKAEMQEEMIKIAHKQQNFTRVPRSIARFAG